MEGKPAMITSKRIADLEHLGFSWEFKSMRIRKPYIPVKKRRTEDKKRSSRKNKQCNSKETTQHNDDDGAASSDQDESESADDKLRDEEMQHLVV
jgi:hypothetical protein